MRSTHRQPEPPALQRLPPRTPEGKALREAFRPKALLTTEVDYESLELRIWAACMEGKK